MRSDNLTIQPQIVQFGRDNTQTIKIINNTSQSLTNFFFCLYNTEKFTFSPDSFSLAPHEHKLITVTLRVKSGRSSAKEFAYLKSTDVNRRITLILNQFQSPQVKSRTGEQGYEDLNTLSSRDYKDVQTQAIEKIIRQKEAYIAMLEKERDSVNRNINFKTEQSGEKAAHFRRELDELSMKYTLMENQKQSIERQNAIIHNKFEEYKKLCEADLSNYEIVNQNLKQKLEENNKLQQEINFLQIQGNQFLSKIQDKQNKIRQLEQLNRKMIEDSKKDAQKKFSQMEQRLQQQKQNYQQSAACAEQRIKDLQRQLEESQRYKQKTQYYQKQIKKRQDEVKSLMAAIQTQRSNVKQLEAEKKKMIKLQISYENLTEKNSDLTSRLKQMEKINHNLKEQLFVYKSKVAENDASSDKMNQYMEIALESCRNENEALKRTKNELQKSLDQIMNVNRQSHDNNRSMSDQVSKYKDQIKLLNEIKDSLQRRNQQIKQEHHLAMMQLKTQNIELLQKLSVGGTSKRQDIIKSLQDQNHLLKKDLAISNVTVSQLTAKNEQLLVDNTKLTEKVKKYKKEAKKELKSINDTAINQLNKQHEEKKQMAKRISQLEEVILNISCDKVKDSKDNENRNERSSSRVIGIKDQRKEIQYSQGSNTEVYGQLGQLRQLNKFIREEQDRFNRMYNLIPQQEADRDETRTVFRVIRFFKRLENKLNEERGQQNMTLLKQTQYLKGRIKELEVIKQDKENLTSVNLSKTREHCSQLLQFVRQQMKSQYKKLNEGLKLSEQKFELLKKKIYEQYRARIIDNLNKKDKHTIAQLQTILERFIDGMSNLSHKEAVLHKQIKLKQNARKQNTQLKQKVNQLNFLLQSKKGHCTRDPVKLLYNQTQIEWQESLKRQAELLTLTAQYQRLKEQFDLVEAQLADTKQQYRGLEKELDEKSSEILKLKKYQIEIQNNYESQIQRQYEIIEENKKKVVEMTKTTKQTFKHFNKEKEYNQIKDSYDRQKDVIKQLRDKEKMLQELLEETHRSEQKEKRKINQEARISESMRDLKESNRQLRSQNSKLKEKLTKLEDELEKKALYMKNLKGDLEQNRVRVQRKDEAENDILKEQNKKLTKDLQKTKDELDRLKKKKEKELAELKNQIDRLKNENLITEKSLQSIIRALVDTVRKVYGRLRRVIKKRGKDVEDQSKIFQNFHGVQVNALKIDETFEQILTVVEEQE